MSNFRKRDNVGCGPRHFLFIPEKGRESGDTGKASDLKTKRTKKIRMKEKAQDSRRAVEH